MKEQERNWYYQYHDGRVFYDMKEACIALNCNKNDFKVLRKFGFMHKVVKSDRNKENYAEYK